MDLNLKWEYVTSVRCVKSEVENINNQPVSCLQEENQEVMHVGETMSDTSHLQRCNVCNYNAKCNCDFTRHMFWHRDFVNLKSFKCPFCDYNHYKTGNNFRMHLLSHRNSSSELKCRICDYLSKSVQDLDGHLLLHKDPFNKNLFNCSFCPYRTKMFSNLNLHMLVHQEMLKCCVCEREYVSRNDLVKHFLKHKVDLRWYKCDFCDYKSKCLSSLRLHSVTHKDLTDKLTCCICNYRCQTKEERERHLSLHKDVENDVFQCYLCEHKTQHLQDLKIHLLTHKPFTDDGKTCCVCLDLPKKHAKKSKTEKQVTQKTRPNQFKCPHCDAKYKSKFSLKLHMQDHGATSEVIMYNCNYCDYKSKFRMSFKRHVSKHQAGKCKSCNVELYGLDLKKHYEIFHSDKGNDTMKAFECCICNLNFETKADLATHLLTHKKPNNACNLCTYKTDKELSWISHMFLHSNVGSRKVFKCDQCAYCTDYSQHLKFHKETHKEPSERNRFKCTHCNAEYAAKQSLRLHMQDHGDPSEVELYRCKHCVYKTKVIYLFRKHKLKHKFSRCGFCNDEINEVDLKEHIEIFHTESENDSNKTFICCICNCKYDKKSDLAKHLLTHKAASNSCYICKYRTKKEASWLFHMLIHSNVDLAKSYKCDQCSYCTQFFKNLLRHRETHKNHSERDIFKCTHCAGEFTSKSSLKIHMQSHGDLEEMYNCDHCDYASNLISKMAAHKLQHETVKHKFCNLKKEETTLKKSVGKFHNGSLKVFGVLQCCICSSCSETKEGLSKHFLLHKDLRNCRYFKCDICGHKTRYLNNLKLHKKRGNCSQIGDGTEDKIEMFTCDSCPFQTVFSQEFKKHLKQHTESEIEKLRCDKTSKTIECKSCDFKTKFISHLKMHVKNKHPNRLRAIKCCVCGTNCVTKLHLSKHLLLHREQKNSTIFKCNSCNHKTRYLAHLKVHLLTHEPKGVKKFKCHICLYQTPNAFKLKSHKETHKDPSERKYFDCLQCDKKYTTKSGLRNHMTCHKDPSQVKVFECGKCSFKTLIKTSLRNHMVYVHTDPSKAKRFTCDLCGAETKRLACLMRHIKSLHSGKVM